MSSSNMSSEYSDSGSAKSASSSSANECCPSGSTWWLVVAHNCFSELQWWLICAETLTQTNSKSECRDCSPGVLLVINGVTMETHTNTQCDISISAISRKQASDYIVAGSYLTSDFLPSSCAYVLTTNPAP
jgi:hypothetical protein